MVIGAGNAVGSVFGHKLTDRWGAPPVPDRRRGRHGARLRGRRVHVVAHRRSRPVGLRQDSRRFRISRHDGHLASTRGHRTGNRVVPGQCRHVQRHDPRRRDRRPVFANTTGFTGVAGLAITAYLTALACFTRAAAPDRRDPQ